jgi:hypothetical protein
VKGRSPTWLALLLIGTDGDVWYTSDHYGSFEPIDPGNFK